MTTTISSFSNIDHSQMLRYSKLKNLSSGKDPQLESSTNIETIEQLTPEKNAGAVGRRNREQVLNAKLLKSYDVVKSEVASEAFAEYWTEERIKEAIPHPMAIPGYPRDEERMKEAIPHPMAIPGYPGGNERIKEAIPHPMAIPGYPRDEERMKEPIPHPMAIPGYPTDLYATNKARIITNSCDQALTEKSSVQDSSSILSREKNAGKIGRSTMERVLSAELLTWYDGTQTGVASHKFKFRLDTVA